MKVPSNIRINKGTPPWLFMNMTTFIEILRVTNSIIIEGNGFLIWHSTKSHIFTFSNQPPKKAPPSPVSSTRTAAVAEAGVLHFLVDRKTRR